MFRYFILGGHNESLSVLPEKIKELGINVELFGSPFNNSSTGKYYSAFPDVENVFGSLGSFKDCILYKEEKYLCNPPFDESIILYMSDKLREYLNNEYNVYMVLPAWNDSSVIQELTRMANKSELSVSTPFYNFMISKVIYITVDILIFGDFSSLAEKKEDIEYLPFESEDQIYEIMMKGNENNKYMLSELIASFLWYTNSAIERKRKTEELLYDYIEHNAKDSLIYREIAKMNKNVAPYNEVNTHVNRYYDILYDNKLLGNIGNILDVGSGTGYFIEYLGQDIKAKNIYGTDIKEWQLYTQEKRNPNIKFVEMKGDGSLPFESEMFSHVFCSMTLHHIPEMMEMITSMDRVLMKDGYLFIRDHDAQTNADKMIIDIAHKIYIYMESPNIEKSLKEYYAKYFTREYLDNIMKELGYEIVVSEMYPPNSKYVKPQRPFYAIYKKK